MWRSWVVGAIQGAILAPLTLVEHALPLNLPILGLSAGELSCRQSFFPQASLLWRPLPAATVWCRPWFCLHCFLFSFCLSFTSTPPVALKYLSVLQAVQPWSLGVPTSYIREKRNSRNSSLSVIQLPPASHRHSHVFHADTFCKWQMFRSTCCAFCYGLAFFYTNPKP